MNFWAVNAQNLLIKSSSVVIEKVSGLIRNKKKTQNMVRGKKKMTTRWTAGNETINLKQDIFDDSVLFQGPKLMDVPRERLCFRKWARKFKNITTDVCVHAYLKIWTPGTICFCYLNRTIRVRKSESAF